MPRQKQYMNFDQPMKNMPAHELRAALDGEPKSLIMRSIILNEKRFMTVTEYRSLRGFWYATVKPVLSKLGLLESMTAGTVAGWAAELSRYTAELVRSGRLTYDELKIIDSSRSRARASSRYISGSLKIYGYQVSAGENPNVILCTEKDTAVGILRAVASITGCSWMSGGGQNALSAMEPLLRELPDDKRKHLLFLSITDHDPAGWNIAETFADQAHDYRDVLDIRTVHSDRLGIKPVQLTADEITDNAYTPSFAGRTPEQRQKSSDEWLAQGGGINGEPLGLELDAYTPSRLRQVLIEGLRSYIQEPRHDYLRDSYIRSVALAAMEPHLNAIIQDIINHERDKITVLPFDVWELAHSGYSTLPVDELCERDRDKAIERAALAGIGKA